MHHGGIDSGYGSVSVGDDPAGYEESVIVYGIGPEEDQGGVHDGVDSGYSSVNENGYGGDDVRVGHADGGHEEVDYGGAAFIPNGFA